MIALYGLSSWGHKSSYKTAGKTASSVKRVNRNRNRHRGVGRGGGLGGDPPPHYIHPWRGAHNGPARHQTRVRCPPRGAGQFRRPMPVFRGPSRLPQGTVGVGGGGGEAARVHGLELGPGGRPPCPCPSAIPQRPMDRSRDTPRGGSRAGSLYATTPSPPPPPPGFSKIAGGVIASGPLVVAPPGFER